MFTQVPAAAPTSQGLLGSTQVSTPHSSSAAASPSQRPSRLRGLSYLRNYTQTHLLSREHQHSQTTPSSPTGGGAPLTQTASLNISSAGARPYSHLHRTTSASAATTLSPSHTTTTATTTTTTTTTTAAPPANNSTASSRTNTTTNRLTLVNPPESHPLSLAPSSRPSASRRSTDSALPPVLVDLTTSSAAAAAENQGSTTPSTEGAPSAESNANMVRTRSATMSETTGHNGTGSGLDILPSIRFSTFYDPRAARPSLTFTPISRTLPTGHEVIRVGRYSERDSQPNVPPNVPSAAPVGFKSKVVSRRHCEFWYEGGKWYIKDVKSSSGTFLNHIRLSPPGTESKPFPINDGDIVQLGIDFKGGEEMIFRCVKMRLELNRGWQNKLNTFNMTTHKRLRNMTASSGNASATQSYTQDCSICLNSIAPCQCLFVAPCSHTWHYKCIRSLLSSPSYPIFICPNCRAAADLEADVEDPEEWEQADSSEENDEQEEAAALKPSGTTAAAPQSQTIAPPRKSRESARSVRSVRIPVAPPTPALPVLTPAQHDSDAMDVTMTDASSDTPANNILQSGASSTNSERPSLSTNGGQLSANATSSPMPIPTARTASGAPSTGRNDTRTPSPTSANNPAALMMNGHEGPITPRNDAGPWVFDGSGVRMRLGDAGGTASLDAAANAAGGGGGGEMILDEIHVRGNP